MEGEGSKKPSSSTYPKIPIYDISYFNSIINIVLSILTLDGKLLFQKVTCLWNHTIKIIHWNTRKKALDGRYGIKYY